MGKHAFWTASFQRLAKILVVALWGWFDRATNYYTQNLFKKSTIFHAQ